MKKSTARADSYVRPPDFADHLAGVCFPPEVWAVFAQCDTPRPPAEIARRTHLDEKTVGAALRRLARARLVQKHQLDWQAYLATQGSPAAGTAPPPVTTAPVPAPVATPASPPAPPPPLVVVAAVPAVPPVAAIPAAVPPETPLEFTVANASAAVARRVAAREVLAISVGKSTAPAGKPALAA